MSVSTNTVWEVRTTGDDANGGAFVTGASGANYSQQDSKRTAGDVTDISTTDAVAAGTSTITSATANFQTTIIGNIICLQGGTGSLAKGWYQVTARASATSITVDRTVAAGTGITMNIGGALASLGMVGGAGLQSNNYIWVKSGTYTISSSTGNISSGCFSPSATVQLEGYDVTRGDLGTPPLFQTNGVITSFTMINHNSNGQQYIMNINFDGNSRTGSAAISNRGVAYNCKASNFTNGAFQQGSGGLYLNCIATGCSGVAPFTNSSAIDCIAMNNSVSGFTTSFFSVHWVRCLSINNTGATTDGFATSGTEHTNLVNCVAYNNGRHGFSLNANRSSIVMNCIAENNVGWGFLLSGSITGYTNAGFNNTLGNLSMTYRNFGFTTGTSSFFTNAATDNFGLNNNGTGGALVRGTGTPGTINTFTTSVGFLDLGVYQHQDTGGGGGPVEHSSVF